MSSAPPRIGLITCLWGRRILTGATLQYYARARREVADTVEIVGIAVGSEGRPSQRLAANAEFIYSEHPNMPLSRKWNRALSMARSADVDAVLIVGSDDWISLPLLRRYGQLLCDGHDYVGIVDMYLIDARTKRCKKFNGYPKGPRRNETLGLGRMVDRSLLEQHHWKLWPDGLNRGLDRAMTVRLRTPPARNVRDDGSDGPRMRRRRYKVGSQHLVVRLHRDIDALFDAVDSPELRRSRPSASSYSNGAADQALTPSSRWR